VDYLFRPNGTQQGKKEKEVNGKAKKMLTEALMRASIQNNFQIAQVIMLKGIALHIPHDYFCACEYCIEERQSDYLGFYNASQDFSSFKTTDLFRYTVN
jgi:hypothetical protein